MLFNGIDLTGDFRIKDIRGRGLAGYEVELIDISGGPGSYFAGKKIPARKLEIDVEVRASNREEIRKKIEKINGILSVDKPVPIIFPDETDRIYYGVPQATAEEGEYYFKHKGTLTILCPDPYKYGQEVGPIPFVDDTLAVTNNGTAPSNPIIEFEVIKPVTFAMVSNGESYQMIGRPVEEGDDTPAEPLTTIYNQKLNNFVGWTDVAAGTSYNDPLGEGIVTGSFALGNGQWYVNNFGTNSNGWHGPSKKTTFSESIQDFQIDHFISQLNFVGQIGKNILFLLDENDRVIASLGAIDRTVASGFYNKVQFYLGGKKLIFDFQGFNNTQMWLRLKREGSLFTAKVYQLDDEGNTLNEVTATFEDRLLEYQAPLRQASVYVATFKEYSPTRMYVNRLMASKVNDLSDSQIPIIANQGDIITFNQLDNSMRINGENRKDIKDFYSQYLKLQPGDNHLIIAPPQSFNTTIRYQEPYK